MGWDHSYPPALTVAPGEKLELELLDASGNRIQPTDNHAAVLNLAPENANPLTGPIYVEDAEAGDTLVIDILDFGLSDWGWTALIPEFGLLQADFPDPFLHLSSYDETVVRFTDNVRLPTRPFAGTIGVAPAQPGCHSAIPPSNCGGNMDIKNLVRGTQLLLPVEVPGALLSVGDGHAAQGDGEVCGTAIETRLSIQIRVSVIKTVQQTIPQPMAFIPSGGYAEVSGGRSLMTTGIGSDLFTAAQDAVRFMIDLLGRRYGLEPELAYCLCGVAGDLRISQLVNVPNWTVGFRCRRVFFADI
ncbi:MAG: acetamidase/formamidase family protein [Candidatus Competibacteraceae bacterium]|nr:acetamidase/formamidase family protein [Candidatus Competibacteraceae bacterium]